MASASEVITYIGVPLAVLGVAPLLWNMGKGFWIRHQLVTSIPPCARSFFSVIMDPASGTVSVTTKHLRVTPTNLLLSDQRPPERYRVSRSCVFGFSFVQGDHIANRESASTNLLQPIAFHAWESYRLAATWMSILQIGMRVDSSLVLAKRSTVDASMSVEPAVLEIEWPAFIYLALALGVDPYDWDLQEMAQALSGSSQARVWRLKDCRSRVRLLAQKVDGGGMLSVSLVTGEHSVFWPRAFASELVMLLEDSGELICVPLLGPEQFLLSDIRGFSRDGLHLTPTKPEGRFVPTSQLREFKDATNPLALLLTWTFYSEQVYQATKEILPISQAMLNFRLRVLNELDQHLNRSETLELPPVFCAFADRVIKALNICWKDAEYQALKGRQATKYRMYIGPPERTQMNNVEFGREPESYINSSLVFEDNPEYQRLVAVHNPVPRLRHKEDLHVDDIESPCGLLARIIVVTSVQQFWPCIRVHDDEYLDEADPANPLGKIFGDQNGEIDNAYLIYMR